MGKCVHVSSCEYWSCRHFGACLLWTLENRKKPDPLLNPRKTRGKNFRPKEGVSYPKFVGTAPVGTRKKVFERDGYRCLNCSFEFMLTFDHVVPKSKGGKVSMENGQTLCTWCNVKKGTKIIDYRKNKQ